MIRVSIFYPNTPESMFNLDYYLTKHIPSLEEILKPHGLVSVEVDMGMTTPVPGTPIPFSAVAHLMFNNFEEMQTALGEHSQEFMPDVSNFTNVKPMVQINRVVYASAEKVVDALYQ